MKTIILLILIVTVGLAGDLNLIFWNVENLFDTQDNPKTRDGDFMPGGIKRYTHRACCLKVEHVADVINHINPELLAMVEVENREILQLLVRKLRHYKEWEILIDEGPDIRGIDPAIMYRRDVFELLCLKYYPVFIEARGYFSRPVMRGDFVIKESGDTLSLFVNHWPSRRGGKTLTDPYRLIAADVQRSAVQDLLQEHPTCFIVMTGDFNDDAADTCLRYLSAHPDIRYLEKKMPSTVNGTYFHDGEWIHFDHFLLAGDSNTLQIREARIVAPDWIREKPEQGPLRFYKGMDISAGYSDHYPICLKLGFKRK
jgi:hypothetical protein